MAKRFTETEKWADAWFMDLPSKYKLFWLYLLDKCDISGVWEVNFKMAKFMIGEDLEPAEVKRILGKRVVEIEDGQYWFIPKFLLFQYPTGLNSEKPAIKSVRDKVSLRNLYPIISERLGNDYLIIKDKDKDKEEDKDIEYPEEFYPNTRAKYEEWLKYRKEMKWKPLTNKGIQKQLDFLKKQYDPIEVIEQSIRNGWQGLFELKSQPKGKSGTSNGRVIDL